MKPIYETVDMSILSWNCRGSQNEKFKKLREIMDVQEIGICCLQETQTNVPNRSISTLFPSNLFKILFTPNSRIINGRPTRMGGLMTIIAMKRVISCRVEDTSTDLTLSHTITFENGRKLLNLYQRPQSQLEVDDYVLSSGCDWICGDFNYYFTNDELTSGPIRWRQFQQLHLSDRYVFHSSFNSYGSDYENSDRSRIGPDHFCSKTNLEEIFEVETILPLVGVSDHMPLRINGSGGFSDCIISPSNDSSSISGYVFDYSQISNEFLTKFWNNLVQKYDQNNSNFKFSDLMTEFANILHFCRKTKKSLYEKTSLLTFEEFQSLMAEQVEDLRNSGMKIGFQTLKRSVVVDTDHLAMQNNNSVKFDKSKTCQTTQFKNLKQRIEDIPTDKRSAVIRDKNARNALQKFKSSFTPITLEEIIASAIKTKKNSTGVDKIPAAFWPKSRQQWQFLLDLFNKEIFGDEPFHESLLTSKLKFISKNDGSLRPISISSRFAALLENCLLPRFHKMLSNSKYHQFHFGFIQNKNIEMLTSSLLTKIYSNKNRKLVQKMLMLDLAKAYDSISLRQVTNSVWRLVTESGDFEYFGTLYAFVVKWASGRTTEFGKYKARFGRGVPQGSPWSCLAFVAALELKKVDLNVSENVEVSLFCFADDCTILLASNSWKNLDIYTPLVVENFKSWFQGVGMKLNESKTEYLDLFRKSETKTIRLLGLFFDTNLKFNSNLSKIKDWIRPRLNFFSMLRGKLGEKFNYLFWRKFMFHLRNRIIFAIFHLTTVSKSTFLKYEQIWNNAIRKMFGFRNNVPVEIILQTSGLAAFSDYFRYILSFRTITYKNIEFSSVFDEIKMIEWGAAFEGRKGLRKKVKILDYFVKADESKSSVAVWKDRVSDCLDVFDRDRDKDKDKCLKSELKRLIIPDELRGNSKIIEKLEIDNINEHYLSKIPGSVLRN